MLRRLGDVCEIIMGQSPAGETYNAIGKGVPLINGPVEFSPTPFGRTIRSKFTTAPTKFCKENDLILCVRGSTTGRINIAGFDACIGRGVAAIRANGYQPWINYFVHSKRDYIYALGAGATFPNVTSTSVADLKLPFPPLPEQGHIVRILDEAFATIDKVKANVEKNLADTRALFEVDLDSTFVGGQGWVRRKLSDFARTQYGISVPMNESQRGFKIFRMGEVRDGRLIDTGTMKYADVEESEFEKYKLRPGDVLFNRTNSFELVGKTGIFDLPGDYCFASYLVRVLPNPGVMLSNFLNYFMNSAIFQISVKQKASRSINQANINATILSNEFVRFPESLEVQQSIVNRLDRLRARTERLSSGYRQKLTALDALKQSVLHQAFSGNL